MDFIKGLEEKEFEIYKQLLSLKRATVLGLAKISGEKRSNLYRILESLINKRLVSEIYEDKKHYFIAESPKALINFVNTEKEKVKSVLPELESLEKNSLDQPKIRFFEGKEGVRILYDELIAERKEVLSLVWSEKLIEAIDFHDEFIKNRVKYRIPARSIYPDTLASRKRKTPFKESRFSKNLKPFDATFLMAGNKVAIFSLKNWITGVLIENKEIAAGFRAFFDALWDELK